MPPAAHPGALHLGTRRVRLASGLVLFGYVLTHLLNHALGNLTVGAMEAGLVVQRWIWQGVLGTTALYLALAVHMALGLWALYQRRHFGWTRGEVLQLVLGLSIPLLLVNHITVTRIALTAFGIEKGYAQELYSFWVASPLQGTLQVTVLLVAWTHGCLGLYFWLRLKPAFTRLGPALLAGALIVPLLALLGFCQGGRVIQGLALDPAWRARTLTPGLVGTADEVATLALWRNWFLVAWTAALILVFLARGVRALRERGRRSIRLAYPNGRSVRVPLGFSVLEASQLAKVPHACVCGGRARCSTCRIRIMGDGLGLPPPSPAEQAVLHRVGAAPAVRLACQLRPLGDLSVVPLLPPTLTADQLRRAGRPHGGEERVIVVMVVDMRDSTGLAESRMPFDAVFIIDRFIDAVGSAITEAGGRPNQFRGDGLLAMFGIDCDPGLACAQAIRAAALIARHVDALNAVLAADLAEPVRFGIGLHSGLAVVGEIGYGRNSVFTALGDTANVASRLEGLCKGLNAEVLMSEEVYSLGRVLLPELPQQVVEMQGRKASLLVRSARRAQDLAGALGAAIPG